MQNKLIEKEIITNNRTKIMDEAGNLNFDMPINQSSVIKVIGVGGGGSNAVNYMFTKGIEGVDFVVCNTDAQALKNSGIPSKIQLGLSLTEGLGAGANPEVGKQAALDSEGELKEMLSGKTKMVFINAGMGGGTGTGAAPVIAKFARELDLLTIGVVTVPFEFEGSTRMQQAKKGIEELRKHVDSLVVINNNKLREVYGNLGFKAGFSKADEVLATASRGIAEVITHHYTQNIDLKDAKTVLENSGRAIMGSSKAAGKNRAQEAIIKALDSPLLDDNKIEGAKNVLLLIVSGVGEDEITIDEIGVINDHIQSEAKANVNIIMGIGDDESLGDSIAVTVVATGFHKDQQKEISNSEEGKITHTLEEEQEVTYDFPNEENNNVALIDPMSPIRTVVPKKTGHVRESVEKEIELISTTELIKNTEVVYDKISYDDTEDFIITPVIKDVDVICDEVGLEENQFEFTFDSASGNSKSEVTNINDIEVANHEEIKPVYYNLEAYDKLESELHNAKKPGEVKEPVEEELQINIRSKVVEKTVEKVIDKTIEESVEISPMFSTIAELTKTSKKRKTTLKKFNHTFAKSIEQNIGKIESEPAYKRNGVTFVDASPSSEKTGSKTTLSVDDNDDLKFRSNNSYLHNNVD